MKARLAYFAVAAASLAQYIDCREGDSFCYAFGAVIGKRDLNVLLMYTMYYKFSCFHFNICFGDSGGYFLALLLIANNAYVAVLQQLMKCYQKSCFCSYFLVRSKGQCYEIFLLQ
jgi:hypothetical protein